jgi:hypothetical protein
MTPPTLAEYRQWAATATRNWTDYPIGNDTTRRQVDARASQIVTPAEPTPTITAAWRKRKKAA